MTRYEFDIACKLSLGYILEKGAMYLMKSDDLLLIHDFTETGVNFHINEQSFMEYDKFINIIDNIYDIIEFPSGGKRVNLVDIVNAYDTTGMIPFISDSFNN